MDLETAFSEIIDFRRSQGQRTTLPKILTMIVLSYMGGYTGYRGIKRFCDAYACQLEELLSLKHSIPSHSTFRTILTVLDDKALTSCFNKWASSQPRPVPGEQKVWLSGDGKALRSTVSSYDSSSQDFEAVVSLYSHQTGLVERLEHYSQKSKEKGVIAVLDILLEELQLQGVVICTDALHSQKKR